MSFPISVNFSAEASPAGSGVTTVTWTQTLTQFGWVANTATLAGQKIIDSNGNLQTAQAAGTTGSGSHPTWNASLGGPTSDGTVTWLNGGSTVNVISVGDVVYFVLSNRRSAPVSTVTGITDSAGFNNWLNLSATNRGSFIQLGSATDVEVWYAVATSNIASGGSFGVTPTFSSATGNFDFIMGVISGVAPSSQTSTANGNVNSPGPFVVGPVFPGSLTVPNNAFVLTAFSHDYTTNAFPSGWTKLRAAGNGFETLYDLFATGSAVNPGVAINVPGGGDYSAWAATQSVFLPVLVSIAVTPSNPSVAQGLTEQFTATGTYSDGSTADLTSSATWTSSDPSKATIGASTGLATTIAAGATTIEAAIGSINGSTTLTVTAASLVSIAISPTNPSIALGLTQAFTALGTLSDSSTLDLTSSVAWTSSDPSKATIAAGGLASSSLATGTTTIGASLGAVSAPTTTLTITAAVLASIAVTPPTASIASLGSTQQYTAIGTYTDSSTADITNTVTWASSATSQATIASGGLATSANPGSTNITATLSAITSDTAVLTVTAEILVTVTGEFQFSNTARVAFGSVSFTRRATFSATGAQLITDGTPVVAQLDANGNFSVQLDTYDSIVKPTSYAMVVYDAQRNFLMDRFVYFQGGGTQMLNAVPNQNSGTDFPPQYNDLGHRLIQGGFGSPAANGKVSFQLYQQAVVSASGVQIVPTSLIYQLDGSGNLPAGVYLYLSTALAPHTLYLIRVDDMNGNEIFKEMISLSETSSVPSLTNLSDLSTSVTVPGVNYTSIPGVYFAAVPWKKA